MLDLETFGTRGDTAIASIGAVAFDPHGNRVPASGVDVFYANVDLQSCIDLGMRVDGSTVAWWMKQSDSARSGLFSPEPKDINLVLRMFTQWYKGVTNRGSFVWSHGATFDVPIITEACLKAKLTSPWQFWSAHDTRTLFDLVGIKLPSADTRTGGHNSLADAIAQAKHVQLCMSKLLIKPGLDITVEVPEENLTPTVMEF